AQSHGSGPLRVVEGCFAISFYTTKRPHFYVSYRRESADRVVHAAPASRSATRNLLRVTQLTGSMNSARQTILSFSMSYQILGPFATCRSTGLPRSLKN